MAALTLYGAPGSGSAAIEMALRAAGLAYTVHEAATWLPGPGLDALRAVNPLQQVPALVLADGSVLTESAAILIHLGLTCPQAALLPTDAATRAQALRGLVFIAANGYAAVGVSDHPERWTTATHKAAHQAVRAAARAQLHRSWEVFADSFAGSAVLSGPPPGALAFLAVVVSQWSGSRAHLRRARPAFLAELERLAADDRLRPVLQAHAA